MIMSDQIPFNIDYDIPSYADKNFKINKPAIGTLIKLAFPINEAKSNTSGFEVIINEDDVFVNGTLVLKLISDSEDESNPC